ncbi:MAG: E3 ubiquitin protein ligase [archaeon]|nr:E3 ubiquitin protein ligase [archaeon]
MSLINKFSVSHNFENSSKKRKDQIGHSYSIRRRENGVLDNELAQDLIKLGYNIQTLMNLVKVNSFESVDEALNLLSKDPETGKYPHRFYQPDDAMLNKLDTPCAICGATQSEHNEDYYYTESLSISPNQRKNQSSQLSNKNKGTQNIQDNKQKSQNNSINDNPNNSVLNTKNNVNNPGNNSINLINNDVSQTPLIESNNNLSGMYQIAQSNIKTYSGNVTNSEVLSPKNDKIKKFNPGNYDIPKETLELFDDPNICRICFENKINSSNQYQSTCGHFFCDKCIKTYITTKIINGQVLDIKCLMGGCPKRFTDEEIEYYTDKELFAKYKKFRNHQIKLNNPERNYVQCPFPDCEELVDVTDIIEEDEGDDDEEFITCDKGHTFCLRCRQLGRHGKGDCKKKNELLEQIQHLNKNGRNFKQCPRCKVIIEKNEGCNQMHCINCNYNFCWLCLKKYTPDHYAIYNVSGCPGMRFERESESKWMKNSCLKCLWYLLSCILGFFAVIAIFLFYVFFGCAYEFIHCYTKNKNSDDEEGNDEDEFDFEMQRQRNNSGSNSGSNSNNNSESNSNQNGEGEENGKKKKKMWIICLLGFLGFLCQPLYLMFYILYGLMECYRRFNCWFYYVDY